jgi:hypothetical protein
MRLKLNESPGRANRKLKDLIPEIVELRAAGYTISAIQRACNQAGYAVGWTTVQRELTRAAKTVVTQALDHKPKAKPIKPATTAAGKTIKRTADVDEFFAHHNSNPLFNKQRGSKK